MKAVILAAGEGTRLEPLTDRRPKPMIPIANRPLLEHVVEAVAAAGIEELVLVVGYERERIQSYFGDGDDWGIDIEYAIQDKQLGTGHAILQAEPHVSEDFLVVNGDRIFESSIVERLIEADRDGDVLVSVTRADDPSRYGVVELEGDRIVDIVEKPPRHAVPSDVINAGVYVFGPSIFEAIHDTKTAGELAITATLRKLAEEGVVRAVRYRGLWLDVSHLWDVVDVNATVLDQTTLYRPSTVRVHDQAVVADPVSIGEDVRVQPNATVLRGTALGGNVRVGSSATVVNTVVMSDATIGAGAVVRDAVIGENARVGPNVTIEGGEADVVGDDALYGDVTLGGVVGDNATLGGNVTVAPGTVVGNDATVESGTTIDGRLPPGTIVRRG